MAEENTAMDESKNSLLYLNTPDANSTKLSSSKCKFAADHFEKEYQEESEHGNEQNLQALEKKLRLLEKSLEEQRTNTALLREERDEGVTVNSLLKREVEELRREVYTGKKRASVELQHQQHGRSRKYSRGLEEDQSVVGYMLSLPSKFVRGFVNRAAMFVWWTGHWANEGLGILRIENKWVGLQQMKDELEEDNCKLEEQIHELQHLLTDKEVQIVRQMERNKDLLSRLNNRCGVYNGNEHQLDKLARNVQAIKTFTESLSEEIDRMKDTMDRWMARFDKVHREIGRLAERQRRIEETEESADIRTQSLADHTANGCNCCKVAGSREREIAVSTDLITEKVVESNNDKADKGKKQDKSSIAKDSNVGKRSRSCRLCCCSLKYFIIFVFIFLITGVTFHFILVSGSLTFPFKRADEFYGVDLYALWAYFINWFFCLLVTE